MSLAITFKSVFAASVLGLMSATAASAATLNFYNSVDPDSTLRFSVACSLGCEGALFDGTPSSFSPTKGALTTFPGGNTLSVLNAATGESFTSEIEVDRGGAEFSVFTSSAKYIAFKVGTQGGNNNSWAIIKNLAADNEFTFTKLAKKATGLSNTREYGEIAPVPLPAAGYLLVAAIGAIALLRRRKMA